MEFTLHPTQFDQLAWAAKTAPQRPPAPILTGVKITSHDGHVTAETYDYTTHTKARLTPETSTNGTVIVSGRLLAEIIRSLPKKTAQFRASDGKLEVRCGASKFTLNTMQSDEYPTPPTAGEPIGCVNAEAFFEAVNRAVLVASKDDTLPLLAAVRFEFTDTTASLLATDRYRLTVSETPWDGRPGEFLVPARTLHDVSRALTGDMTIHSNGSIVTFEDHTRSVSVSLTEGEFPPARRLIPEATPITAVVNVKALTDVVKRVAIVAERGTPIALAFEDDEVTVTAGQGDDANATEVLQLESRLVGDPIRTAFNPQFLLDALESQPASTVQVGFTHPAKPVLFTPGEGFSGTYTYLLVPIRIP